MFFVSFSKKVLKYPGLIHFPYVENFGMMLIMFINADFSSFDKEYKTFFYAYRYELLKEYIPYKELATTYTSQKKMLDIMKRVYESSLQELIELQHDFRNCVDQIYNLNGIEELNDCSAKSKFIANIITHKSEVYRYSSKIEVVLDSYAEKDVDYNNEVYCEFANEKGKTCKEKGALQTYKKNLENIPALLEYRRSYQRKIMIVSRNKENKQLKKDFDKWKKDAQDKIKLFKQGKLEEEKLYNWMIENK